ncbi:MAG: sulfotransferase [Bacteroidetes bacterium]|nr:sulfotransferase [Bacteroidota bacterium]
MGKNKSLPDFLVIGPPKTASTSLHYYLGQHPEIFMAAKKETRFFDLDYEKGISFYKKYFELAGDNLCKGEATPTYAFLPFVAKRIHENIPNVKLIFTFRDPVERAYSGWLMRSAKGNEKLNFRQAMEANLEQRSTIDFYKNDVSEAWLADQSILGKKNEISLRTYIEGGLYSKQLKAYQMFFRSDDILIIYLEDIKKDVDAVMKSIFTFLGVDNTFKCVSDTIKNKHNKNRLKFLFNIFGKNAVLKAGKIFPSSMKDKIISMVKVPQKKTTMSESDRDFAYEIFKEDIETLEKMLNRSLDNWKVKDKY